MWSGPRNISTAMMRAWENRPDTQVIDEPFYAHFLQHTGLDHPMCSEVISHGETDWRAVVEQISTPPQSGLFYQKHITAHWLDHLSVDWLDKLSHVFLIREPEPVVASYAIKRDALTTGDVGYAQQAALFDHISSHHGQPVLIDSKRFLADPAAQLKSVCHALDVTFFDSMLSWPAGPRDTDGIWGSHWYDAVNRSTGFGPARNSTATLDKSQQRVADICRPYYESMLRYAI